jgi:hypothetical protein
MHRQNVGDRSNGSQFRRSARRAGCIGQFRGCARSLSCLLVVAPLTPHLFCAAKHWFVSATLLTNLRAGGDHIAGRPRFVLKDKAPPKRGQARSRAIVSHRLIRLSLVPPIGTPIHTATLVADSGFPTAASARDCRDLGQVFEHGGPIPHPPQDTAMTGAQIRNSNRRHAAHIPRPQGLRDGGRAAHQKQGSAQHGGGQRFAEWRHHRGGP